MPLIRFSADILVAGWVRLCVVRKEVCVVYRLMDFLGDYLDSAEAVEVMPPDSGESLSQRGIGAFVALQVFGSEYAEPYARWAWQYRDQIVQESPEVGEAFMQSVSLRVAGGPAVTLPWHRDSFSAVYVLVLAANDKRDQANEIAVDSAVEDTACLKVVDEVLRAVGGAEVPAELDATGSHDFSSLWG